MADYYKVLQVDRDAEPEVIHAAYKRLVAKYHPDVTGGSGERMAEINEAYEVLRDTHSRAEYDRYGKASHVSDYEGDLSEYRTEHAASYEAPPSFLARAWKFSINAYFAIALVLFAPYYNFKYAGEVGWAKWLFGGEARPTFQAFFWPYYLFAGQPYYVMSGKDSAELNREANIAYFRQVFAAVRRARSPADTERMQQVIKKAERNGFKASRQELIVEFERDHDLQLKFEREFAALSVPTDMSAVHKRMMTIFKQMSESYLTLIHKLQRNGYSSMGAFRNDVIDYGKWAEAKAAEFVAEMEKAMRAANIKDTDLESVQ